MMRQSPPLQDIVVEILTKMGVSAQDGLIRTLALQGGRLVAEKFRYEGGYAICPTGSDVIEVYDYDGQLLKSVAISATKCKETAA
jgi:hypothetical protein